MEFFGGINFVQIINMVDPLVRKILLDSQSEHFLELPLYKSSHSMGEMGMVFDVKWEI